MSVGNPALVGAQIRKLRLARGLTQQDLTGPRVSIGYVSLIELGKRSPSSKVLRHIADVLGVDEQEIVSPQNVKELLEVSDSLILTGVEVALLHENYREAKTLINGLTVTALSTLEGRMCQLRIDMFENPNQELMERCESILREAIKFSSWSNAYSALLTLMSIAPKYQSPQSLIVNLSSIEAEVSSMNCTYVPLWSTLLQMRSALWLEIDDLPSANADLLRAGKFSVEVSNTVERLLATNLHQVSTKTLASLNFDLEQESKAQQFRNHLEIQSRTHCLEARYLFRSNSLDFVAIDTCRQKLEADFAMTSAGVFSGDVNDLCIALMSLLVLRQETVIDLIRKIHHDALSLVQTIEILILTAVQENQMGARDTAVVKLNEAAKKIQDAQNPVALQWHIRTAAEMFKSFGEVSSAYALLNQLVASDSETQVQLPTH